MAVATEGGLITPIVRSANTKPLAQISAEVGRPGIVSVPAAGCWVQRNVMRCLRELRRALCGLAGTSFLAPTAWLALPSSHPPCPLSIWAQVRELAGRARANKLQPHEFQVCHPLVFSC